jgi:hypothetical protein
MKKILDKGGSWFNEEEFKTCWGSSFKLEESNLEKYMNE